MPADPVCARCGTVRHTLVGVCPSCGYDGDVALAGRKPPRLYCPGAPPSRCPHCGAGYDWGTPDCGDCGRRVCQACSSCGAANAVGNRHCVYCGARSDSVASLMDSASSLRPVVFRFSPIDFARERIPPAYWPYLLSSGLLAIVSAQLIFNLADSRSVPTFGALAMTAGILAVGLWAALAGCWYIPEAADKIRGSGARTSEGNGANNSVKIIWLATGLIALAALLIRVATGHGATWDVALWLVMIAGFGAAFIPNQQLRINPSLAAFASRRALGIVKARWREALPLLVILAFYCAFAIPNLTAWRYSCETPRTLIQ